MDAAQGIHVVAKPAGPVCNLNCEYSFYLEKQVLFGTSGQNRMPDSVLSAFISNYVSSQPTPVVEFVWQGGEPILQGKDFFKRVVELQKPFARLKTMKNLLQLLENDMPASLFMDAVKGLLVITQGRFYE